MLNLQGKNLRRAAMVLFVIGLSFLFSSCRGSRNAEKRYHFSGRVVSINRQDGSAVIDGDTVPGFMEAMAMSYKFKPAGTALSVLSVGDSISADLVTWQPEGDSDNAIPDHWLENVKVTGHGENPPGPASGAMHVPAAGEVVPNFRFTNQSGQRISLEQYRGKTLLVTFIYTRCPFPDFCPRMTNNFGEIYKRLASNPALANAELLSISFDPEHDTPKVLREYGFSAAHTRDAAVFKRWQFAVPNAADLPKIASFFALTVKPEGGTITHTLSTAVIGPDGEIAKWYHGGGWQVSDLIKDVADVGDH